MRIIGGIYKGRKIKSIAGTITRPTTDFVREALFNIISTKVIGSSFLDLYAGTGAVGLEALSRGAKKAVFIEKNRIACSVIKQNLRDLNIWEKGKVIHSDTSSALKNRPLKGCFDIIFMDPPYYNNQIEATLGILNGSNMVKSIVVVQHSRDESFKINGFHAINIKHMAGLR